MTRVLLVLFWVPCALVLAAGAAELLGYVTAWGGRNGVFKTFLIPFPLALGILHVPSLAVGAILVAVLPGLGMRGRRRLLLCLGLVFAVSLVLDWEGVNRLAHLERPDADMSALYGPLTRFRRSPLLLFIMCDALLLMLVVGLVPLPVHERSHPEVGSWVRRTAGLTTGVTLAPILTALAAVGVVILAILPRYTQLSSRTEGCVRTEFVLITNYGTDRFLREHLKARAFDRRPETDGEICRQRVYYFDDETAARGEQVSDAVLGTCANHKAVSLYRAPHVRGNLENRC